LVTTIIVAKIINKNNKMALVGASNLK